MAILKVFNKGKNSKEELANNYLSLTITPEKVLAYIWNFDDDGNVKTIGTSQKNFLNRDVLIHEAAVAIDKAGENSNADVRKVVFGLSQNWLENNDLDEETADLLKQLTDDLELEAQAFISLASAINHHYKVEESVTPHAVLVGIFPNLLEVHLIENNKVQKTLIENNEPTLQKIESQISTLKAEGRVLPSKIVIYGAKAADKISASVEKHVWEHIFIHPPKIEYITDEQLAKSVSYAHAADILGREPMKIAAAKQEKPQRTQTAEPQKTHAPDAMGFIEGEDILSLPEEDQPSETVNVLTGEELTPTNYIEPQGMHEAPKHLKKAKISLPFSKIIDKITNLSWLPNLSFIKRQSKRKLTTAVAIILIVLISIGYFFAQSVKSATVKIKVNGQAYNKDFNARVITGTQADASSGQISGSLITANQDGSQKAVTTGTKNIGQQATGQVNVFNWTTAQKTFSKGSTLISKDGIKFTINDDVNVASRSATTPGETQTNVTAVDFGDKGNIGANTDFTFSQYDELLFSARNDNAFSGGNQKQVTVASQEDLDKLKKSLMDSLVQKAKDQLNSQANGQKLDDGAISTVVIKSNFDKKAGDEASLVNLDMTITATAITYNLDDLKNTLAQNTAGIPEGFTIQPQDIQFSNLATTKKDTSLKITGSLSAKLIPKIDTESLLSSVAGKSTKDAIGIIKQNSQVADVTINFSPSLPFFSALPGNKSKIKVQLETN